MQRPVVQATNLLRVVPERLGDEPGLLHCSQTRAELSMPDLSSDCPILFADELMIPLVVRRQSVFSIHSVLYLLESLMYRLILVAAFELGVR